MRSMLYSLALRGDTAGALEVAGGTIFNEIQLWAPGLGEDASDASDDASSRPDPWAILRGHDGSVMRVTWASDFEDEAAAAAARLGAGGDLVFSTSDDRTARAWAVPPRPRDAPSAPPRRPPSSRRWRRRTATPRGCGTAARWAARPAVPRRRFW